jgi:hypothetical protein
MTPSPNDVESVLRFCSACAGDYEDPGRTVPDQDECDDEPEAEMDQDRDDRVELGDGMPAEGEELPVSSTTADGSNDRRVS